MPTSAEAVAQQASMTATMAAAAKLMEDTAGQPQLGSGHYDKYTARYNWINGRCGEFCSPASYAFAGITVAFDDLVNNDFQIAGVNEQGVTPGIVADRFQEIKQLIPIIQEESHGQTFVAFRDKFLQKLDITWINQARIAQSLSAVPKVEAMLYEAGRKDVIQLAVRAQQRFEMICARERGDEPAFPGESTALSTAGVLLTITGLASRALSGPAGWASLAVGLASFGANNEPVAVPPEKVEGVNGQQFKITGEKADDVAYSLSTALTALERTMGDAEDKIKTAIDTILSGVQGEARGNVVAPDVAFPR